MKPAEIRELSDAQLVEKLKEMRAELFNLRFQMATSQLDNTARVNTVKKDIARVLTEQRAREIAAEKSAGENMTDSRNSRKVRTGVVTSVSGAKTIVVTITERKRHPKYGKMMTSSKKLHAHDEECTAGVGDTVRVMETRPMSKMKRWRLIEVVERAK